jgi:NADH dehydrogenase/NADH:ubiquinone oxidoreductase subunit G
MSDEPSGSAAGTPDEALPDLDLDQAERYYRQIQDGFRIVSDVRNIEAAGQAEQLIVQAGKKVAGWGRLKNQALRDLGKYLDNTPRLRGRPKKESDADSFPSLLDLGVKDRHVAADAIKAARVPQAVFDEYQRAGEPTFAGLLRYAEVVRLRYTADPVQQRIEDDIIERGRANRSRATATKKEAVSYVRRSRVTALQSTLNTLLHPNTGDTERSAAARAVERLVPNFAEHVIQVVQEQDKPERPLPQFFYEYQEQLAERDDLIVEQRKIINQLKRGKGDRVLKQENVALRKEIAALRDRIAELEQKNLDLYNQNIELARAVRDRELQPQTATSEAADWKARAERAEARLVELDNLFRPQKKAKAAA